MKKRANRILSAILAAIVVVTMSGMTVFAEEVSSAPVAPEEGSSSSAPATPEGEDASSSTPTTPEQPSEPDKSNPSTGDAYPMAALITALVAVSVAGATFSRKRR